MKQWDSISAYFPILLLLLIPPSILWAFYTTSLAFTEESVSPGTTQPTNKRRRYVATSGWSWSAFEEWSAIKIMKELKTRTTDSYSCSGYNEPTKHPTTREATRLLCSKLFYRIYCTTFVYNNSFLFITQGHNYAMMMAQQSAKAKMDGWLKSWVGKERKYKINLYVKFYV